MIDLTPYSLLLPTLLYAETHYRFRYFFSYLKKPEPELLADAPHWLEPGQALPLLILSKDAHQYPCTVYRISAKIIQDGRVLSTTELLQEPLQLNTHYWWKVFSLDCEVQSGWFEVDVEFEIQANGKRAVYRNDNYKTSSQAPLRVYRAKEPLPRLNGLVLGDCHTHSTYTEDQVEYGSPLEASVQLCKSMGLSFFCVTDHSYDLDDTVDSYLENDTALPKWNHLHNTIDRLNTHNPHFTIIRGEEVSCRNTEGRNVHLVLLGNRQFFPGAGDSAERWLKTRSAMSVKEVLLSKDEHTLAVAAHPRENVPLLQRLLLGRGEWTSQDLRSRELAGIQFLNGHRESGFQRGYRNWVECLLQGQRVFAFGGNDAHGNFNRFRQIGIPFFKIRESNQQLFGKAKTGIFLEGSAIDRGILDALKAGRSIITDGIAVNMRVAGSQHLSSLGDTVIGTQTTIELEAATSTDLGEIEHLYVYKGRIGGQQEELVYSNNAPISELYRKIELSFEVNQPMYIRAEAYTRSGSAYDTQSHFALSNPLWLNPR